MEGDAGIVERGLDGRGDVGVGLTAVDEEVAIRERHEGCGRERRRSVGRLEFCGRRTERAGFASFFVLCVLVSVCIVLIFRVLDLP